MDPPSEGFCSSVQLHDHATVDYGSEDRQKASKYQVHWSNIMDKGNYSKPSTYQNVAVLLLCWDQGCNDLKTQEELDTLKKVFEDQFGYSATISKLSSPAKNVLQVELNKLVANFVSDHDGPHNLLIVYYAGHGKPGEIYGHLELLGQTSPNDSRDEQQRKLDKVVWNSAEDILKPARADILEIFDCCYAGTLGLTKGDDRLFEFLAAAKANKTTRIPGKESFTSALIYALDRLVRQKEGRFTTDELLRTIKVHAPHFPEDQEPHLAERRDPHTKAGRIMLHPIRRDGVECKIPNEVGTIEQIKKYTVTLHFEFGEEPSESHIERLGQGFNEQFRNNNLDLLRIRWGEMNASGFVLATRKFQSSLLRRRSSKKEERPTKARLDTDSRRSVSTLDQNLLSPLSPPESRYHSQDSAGNTDNAGSVSADSSVDSPSMPKSRQKRRRTSQHCDNML